MSKVITGRKLVEIIEQNNLLDEEIYGVMEGAIVFTMKSNPNQPVNQTLFLEDIYDIDYETEKEYIRYHAGDVVGALDQ